MVGVPEALTIYVTDDDARWEGLGFDATVLCETALNASFKVVGSARGGEVSVLLSSDPVISLLNERYRGIAGPTNVLSFAFSSGSAKRDCAVPKLLGDIVLSFDTIILEAAAANITTRAHFAHMVVHGGLHLLGYDHQDQEQARIMEELEVQSLAAMGIGSPYAACSDRGEVDDK